MRAAVPPTHPQPARATRSCPSLLSDCVFTSTNIFSIDLQTFFHNSLKGFQEILKSWGKNQPSACLPAERLSFVTLLTFTSLGHSLNIPMQRGPWAKSCPPPADNSCGRRLPRPGRRWGLCSAPALHWHLRLSPLRIRPVPSALAGQRDPPEPPCGFGNRYRISSSYNHNLSCEDSALGTARERCEGCPEH